MSEKILGYRPDKIEIKIDLSQELGELQYTEYLTYLSKEKWKTVQKNTRKHIDEYLKMKLPKGWSISCQEGDRCYIVKVRASKLGILAPIFAELAYFVTCNEALHLIKVFVRGVEKRMSG